MKLLNVHLGNVLREWLRRTEPEPLVVIDPHLVIITFCPLFDENRNSFDKSWPVGSTPCHHGESLMLHVPSRSVFWGILWKTNGVDPGLTPCPVPGLWGTSQLGTNPFLALQKKKSRGLWEWPPLMRWVTQQYRRTTHNSGYFFCYNGQHLNTVLKRVQHFKKKKCFFFFI